MPSKNSIKFYLPNSFYHIYNRGVEKRIIFLDEHDCILFLHYLKLYLLPIEEVKKQVQEGTIPIRFLNLNLSTEVDLLAFALMPNHFHLLLKQYTTDGIIKLMKRLSTGYVMYFNKKYERVGPLFQGIYKACPVQSDEYLLHLSRYIHLNGRRLNKNLIDFCNFTSFAYYTKEKNALWIKPDEILKHFSTPNKSSTNNIFSYKSFVDDYLSDSRNVLGELTLETDCIEGSTFNKG